MLELIWLIPLLPVAGLSINGLFGRRMSRGAVGAVACGAVLLSLLVSAGAVWELSGLPEEGRRFETELASTWMPLGDVGAGGEGLRVSWGFALDPISSVLLLVVTGVGFLIHVYSVGYMAHEEGFSRFFVYLNLFMAMMLTLTLGSNLLVMFVGWEGVGLCSYLLIGFFHDRPFDERTGLSCADAGRKAFITNRIGDFAFLLGVLILATTLGTVSFREIGEAIGHGGMSTGLLTAVGILLFVGACGKSAQIPLYVWLPDAMAGPTPVSALIHAATMVTAGVYMVVRMHPVYEAAPGAAVVVAVVGALTAVFAATMGLTATDIKKVLAYSTVSQLGYMFAAAGVGAYVAAIFHLMTHAFFKGLLFLGAGSVIHGLGGEQDIRKMGGLRSKMPVTHWTFVVASLAIAGVFPLAGFFSKDEILWGAWSSGHRGVWVALAGAAALTAFYMFRLVSLTFWGTPRGDAERHAHAHESPGSMTVPLRVLAVLSALGGLLGVPVAMTFGRDLNVLHGWMSPALTTGGHGGVEGHGGEAASHGSVGVELGLMGLALIVGIVSIAVAVWLYDRRRAGLPERVASASGPVYPLLRNLYWVDELYELVLLRPFYALCRLSRRFDVGIVDGAVNGVRHATLGLSFLSRAGDVWIVDGAVNLIGYGLRGVSRVARRLQTGLVQNYAMAMILGAFALMVIYTLAR